MTASERIRRARLLAEMQADPCPCGDPECVATMAALVAAHTGHSVLVPDIRLLAPPAVPAVARYI